MNMHGSSRLSMTLSFVKLLLTISKKLPATSSSTWSPYPFRYGLILILRFLLLRTCRLVLVIWVRWMSDRILPHTFPIGGRGEETDGPHERKPQISLTD